VRTRIEAELPEALDDAAARDVVMTKPPRGTGERAWWLERLLALAPPELWEAELGRRPEELAKLPVRDNLQDAVRAGWTGAAARRRSQPWAQALLPVTADPRLVSVLPPQIAEPLVARLLGHPLWEALVDELPRPLGAQLSRELVKRDRVYRPIALALHPSVLPLLPDDTPRAAVEVLTFRHDLHQELA
jgi:hypothetical protein